MNDKVKIPAKLAVIFLWCNFLGMAWGIVLGRIAPNFLNGLVLFLVFVLAVITTASADTKARGKSDDDAR